MSEGLHCARSVHCANKQSKRRGSGRGFSSRPNPAGDYLMSRNVRAAYVSFERGELLLFITAAVTVTDCLFRCSLPTARVNIGVSLL